MTVATGRPSAKSVGRGLRWSTTSNLLLRAGNFGVSIVMARLIAPEEFGVFAVALTVWTVLGTLAEFGLGTDLIRARDVERRIPTVATLGLVTSGILAAAMSLGAPLIAAAFDSPESADVLRLMAISMAVFGFTIVPGALLQRAFRQRALFAVNSTALVASTSTMVVLALLGFGPAALAIGQIVNQATAAVGQYLAAGVQPRFGFDRQIAAESARFCLPLAAANLLSWVLLSVDNVLVARVLSPVELGLYVLAFNVSSWPMNALGQAVRVIALPAFAQFDEARLRNEALVRVVGPLWAIAALLGVGLATTAEPLVRALYGDRWSGAGVALAGLGAFGAVRVVFDLLATFLIAVGQTRAVLAVQAIWLAAMAPAMYIGISHFGLAGAGWTHLGVALAVTLPAYLVCLRRVGVSPRNILRPALLPSLVILPTAAVCWYLANAATSPALSILAAGGAALALYVFPLARWWLSRLRLIRSADASDVHTELRNT